MVILLAYHLTLMFPEKHFFDEVAERNPLKCHYCGEIITEVQKMNIQN